MTAQKPAPASLGEPVGTVSEMVAYLQADGRRIALVHQYRRPDGTLAASGRPDPKWLLVEGEILIPAHPDKQTCPECAPHTSYT